MKRHHLSNIKYQKIVKWWLIFLIFFMPFQRNIIKYAVSASCPGPYADENSGWWSFYNQVDFSGFFRRIDEITIAALLPLTLIIFWKNRKHIDKIFWILLTPFIILTTAGFISGMVNGNSLSVTSLGIFEYMKNFVFIFIYAAFFREADEIKKIFRVLLIVGLFVCIIAFVQEVWALVSKYIILQKEITLLDPLMFQIDKWRMGIYRTTSLVGHYNILGFFSLLVLTLYFFSVKKIKLSVFIILFIGILVSVSRMSYLGFAVLVMIQIFKGRKWLLAIILPLGIPLIYMSTLQDFNVSKIVNVPSLLKDSDSNIFDVPYRKYARGKAVEIWEDHPIWGVGPGMFGGIVSIVSRSPYYEEYNFDQDMELLEFLESWKSLDQFWPQILAETGIVGTVTFAGLLASWMLFFLVLIRRKIPDDLSGFFTGLTMFMIMIIMFSFGNPLKSPVIVVYSALSGMGIGYAFLWKGKSVN